MIRHEQMLLRRKENDTLASGARMRSMGLRRVVAFVALLCCQAGGRAQSAARVHPVTGRVIASTMSVEGADWLERPEREGEERPEKAIAALHVMPGMNVGEIGAGTGYYALRIAKRIQ